MKAHVLRSSFLPTDKSKKYKTKQSNDNFSMPKAFFGYVRDVVLYWPAGAPTIEI